MRIPISKADWPESFNSTSKYIGRHWPKGKLKLSQARESTARLMGYHSVHDAQKELVGEIPHQYYSTKTMASSMAVKSVLLYDLNPVDSYRFFSSIPWSNLAVWEHTSEYKTQKMEARGKRILVDEYHVAMNYSTPALIASAFKEGRIPPYEFTITDTGEMFDRVTFESLLEQLDPSEEAIKECGSSLSIEEYFDRYILPLARCSVEEMITRLYPDKPTLWLTPEDVDIVETDDGRYALFNESLDAFYPGVYDSIQLRGAIKQLFLLQVLEDVETKCNIPSGHYRYEKDNMQPFGINGSFTYKEQVFYRREALNDYSEIVKSTFLTYLLKSLKPTKGFTIPDDVIPSTQLSAINKAATINKMIMSSNPDGVSALVDVGIECTLSSLYGKTFYSDERLSNEDMFDLRERYFEDDDERREAEQELEAYSLFCDALGKVVLNCMPELKPYYSERVIGHFFHERYGDEDDSDEWGAEEQDKLNTKAERHLDFFIFLLTDHLCLEFSEYAKGIASRGMGWLLTALKSNEIAMSDFKDGFKQLMLIYRMLSNDERMFSKMEEYCNPSSMDIDEKYVNHGKKYKPTLKKDVENRQESLSNLFRRWRKINSETINVSQTVSE